MDFGKLNTIKKKLSSNITDLSTINTRSQFDRNLSPKVFNTEIPDLTLQKFSNQSISKDIYSSYFSRKKKKLKINLKSRNHEIKKNNTSIKDSKENYSLLMKKLENWDKENLHIAKENPQELYIKLKNLYKKINMKKEIKRLKQLNSLLTQKSNFNKLMEKGAKSNKILEDFFNKRNKDQGSILRNNIVKTKTRYSYSLFDSRNQKDIEQNIGVDSKTINAMNSKDINNQYYNRVIKDKIKYEKQLHSELIDLNNNIQDKKDEKNLTTKKLSNIYNKQSKLTKNYNKIFNERKSLLERFEDEKNRKSGRSNFIETYEISKKNEELIEKIKESKKDYIKNMKTIDSERENCIKDMKRIENEMSYYKQINNELIIEQRQYYLDILKNGYDSRGEGMIWVVRNLLELQTNLESSFSKFYFLTHEEADYLIKIATISLEEIQLKIIMKVLKKKHNDLKTKENIRKMSMVESLFSHADLKRKKSNINKVHRRIVTDYEIQKARIKKEINKKFFKLYTRNEETMKMFCEKNMEDNKEEAFINNLRDCLFGRGSLDNTDNLLKIFQGDEQQKIIFKLILYIRKRLNDLTFIKKKLVEEQINIFKEKNDQKENELNVKQLMQKELVKKCLFGSSENI